MKVELGVEDWTSGDLVFVHETELLRAGHLARVGTTIEGSVRIVADDGTRLHIYDDLTALLAHLGGYGPVHILGEGRPRHAWLQMVQNGDLSITTDGAFLVVARNDSSVRIAAEQLWPALVAAALRFAGLVTAARPDEPWRLDSCREPVARARALVEARGWTLPAQPQPDPPPPPFAPPAWVGVELYVDAPEAPAFYRELLGQAFESVAVRRCVGRMSPQWVGVLGGSDPAELARHIANESGAEIVAEGDHRVWIDRHEAAFASGRAIGGVRVARRVLRTLHLPTALEFYAAALGWTADGERLTREGVEMAALEPAGPGDNEHWRHYLAVDDLDAAVARAVALGATERDRSPAGVWLSDPHGGEFGLARRSRHEP